LTLTGAAPGAVKVIVNDLRAAVPAERHRCRAMFSVCAKEETGYGAAIWTG